MSTRKAERALKDKLLKEQQGKPHSLNINKPVVKKVIVEPIEGPKAVLHKAVSGHTVVGVQSFGKERKRNPGEPGNKSFGY